MNSKNLVLVVILVLAAIGISLFILRGPETTRKWTVEESRIIAENFIMNSPTYKFDGFNLRYVETQTMRCPYCWGFVFEFQSRHSGYGDRTGKILLQVITEHRARVVVDHGKVISAIIDEKWDELNQGFLDIPRELIISLERTGCFGTCPAYGLTIYGNGTVVYEGKNFVKIEGIRTITISKEEIRELISEFEKIDYFSLNENYEKYMATDMPSTITSITIDGRTKTVRHYHGDFTAPKELTGLEDRIDEIVNSDQWIKGEKVSLILSKGVYSTGEGVKFTFNPGEQKIYSENFGQWQIYKFENNEWKSIPAGVIFGCRATDCINGMIIQQCIDPGITICHELLDPVSDSWNQKYRTTEERLCGNQTYEVDVLSHAKPGRYKIRYNYAIDSSCERYSYVEKEFTIKETTESVEVLNKEFTLALDSNPTTGYNWEVQFDKNILELKEKTFEPSPTGLIGAGGKEKFVFIPVKTGETTVTMLYKRSWENKSLEEKKFRFKIIEEKIECKTDPDCAQEESKCADGVDPYHICNEGRCVELTFIADPCLMSHTCPNGNWDKKTENSCFDFKNCKEKDCDDNSDKTTDKCINIGTRSEGCEYRISEQECTKDSDCGTGGCSGQVCTTAEKAREIITTCEMLLEYGCLGLTSCGCVEGRCQWRENSAYRECMDRLKSG